MSTQLVDKKSLHSRTRTACKDIKAICEAGLTLTGRETFRDPVQTLVSRRSNSGDGLILPIIESSAIQAEKMCAGSGELFLRIFEREMQQDISRLSVGMDPDEEWKEILEEITKRSIPARKRDLQKIFTESGEVFERIIFDVTGRLMCDDVIFVKKSLSDTTKISRETGYNFSGLEIDRRFLSRGNWERKNVRVILIDGIIERMSEIHHLVEGLAKSREPCVIFCLGSLPEVIETISKNFLTRSLDVVLVSVPVVHTHINTISDLGVIFEMTPISAAAGDSISLGIKNQNSFAEKITITRTKVLVERDCSSIAVKNHVLNLRKRIEDDINQAQVLEPRISSLSTSCIGIDVGIKDQKLDPNIVEKLDRTFRMMPKILKFGFIEKFSFKGFSSEKIDLLFGWKHEISAEAASQAIKVFISTRETIRSAAFGIESV